MSKIINQVMNMIQKVVVHSTGIMDVIDYLFVVI